MIPVNSSSIAAIGYDRETKRLRVRFTSNAEYEYLAVPEDVAREFARSDSKGSFFAIAIRPKYEFQCVAPRPKKEAPDASEQSEKKKAQARPAKKKKIS